MEFMISIIMYHKVSTHVQIRIQCYYLALTQNIKFMNETMVYFTLGYGQNCMVNDYSIASEITLLVMYKW